MGQTNAEVDSKLMRLAALLDTDPAARRACGRADSAGVSRPPRRHPAARDGEPQRGEPGSAASTFADLADAQPDSAPLQLELGRALAAQGEQARALLALQRAVQLQPDLADAWRELSQLYAARAELLECDLAYANFVRLARPGQHLSEAARAVANRRLASADAMLRRAPEAHAR